MESKGAISTVSSSGAQLIVRVKRRREDDPAETICLYDDNHSQQLEPTSKRNKKSLVNEMSRIMNMNDDTSNPSSGPPRKRLMLQRISTLETYSYATIDQDTAIAINKKRSREATGADIAENHSNCVADQTNEVSNNKKRIKLLVAQSKKTTSLATASTDQKTSCVIVDTMQLFDSSTPTSGTTSNSNDNINANQSPPKKKILDPPTRLLAQAIVTAVTRNDFNDLSRALIQGADINHQLDAAHPTAGGFTALMAAAQRGNIRILKRLLLDSSLTCVRAKDALGRTALDLLPKPTPRTMNEIQEMRQLLEQSVIRQHQQEALQSLENQRQQQKTQKAFAQHGESVFSRFSNSSSTHDAAGALGEEYVVDIYVVQAPGNETQENELVNEEENMMNETDTADASSSNMFSILRVEGLRIDDETGQVELVAYDSDWSDLADDEEPDSNDERHYANDYPDESDEDNGGRMFAEVDDEEEEDSDDDDDDDVGMGSKLHRRLQKRRQPRRSRNFQDNSLSKTPAVTIQPPSFLVDTNNIGNKSVSFAPDMNVEDFDEGGEDDNNYGMDADEEEEDDDDEDIEMDLAKEINQFFGSGSSGHGKGPDVTTLFDGHRNHVSRIMKPFQLGDDKTTGHTTESLQELWGIDGQPMRENSTTGDHEERVEHMRQRTGMVFAANAHEFDRETGLPKFGQELSDDEYDLTIQGYGRDVGVIKPSRDTVAYDSEYDRSD